MSLVAVSAESFRICYHVIHFTSPLPAEEYTVSDTVPRSQSFHIELGELSVIIVYASRLYL